MARLLAALVLLTAGTVAHADVAKARELFQRATRAYNLQKFEQSLELFQQAYEEKDDPVFLFNIAQCQRQLGQYEAAARSYRAYLSQAPNAGNRTDVLARIADMDKAAQEQRAKEPPSGTQPPGSETHAGEAPPPPPVTTSAPPTVTATAPARGSRTLRLAGIGVGAGGVALVALGGGFAALSKSAGDTAYHSPTYDPAADDRQKSYRAADIACFTVGGVAVIAGVTMYLLGARR
jgi:tetratricopeptide (TPR) repeat protein